MALTSQSRIWAHRTADGYMVRVEGHGKMCESLALRRFVESTLCDNSLSLCIDLNQAQYLDSTFLGCLIRLQKRWRQCQQGSFQIIATSQQVELLLAPSQLHRLLAISSEEKPRIGKEVPLETQKIEAESLGQHILECHRQLAEVEGPDQDVFRRVANQLANDLNDRSSG